MIILAYAYTKIYSIQDIFQKKYIESLRVHISKKDIKSLLPFYSRQVDDQTRKSSSPATSRWG